VEIIIVIISSSSSSIVIISINIIIIIIIIIIILVVIIFFNLIIFVIVLIIIIIIIIIINVHNCAVKFVTDSRIPRCYKCLQKYKRTKKKSQFSRYFSRRELSIGLHSDKTEDFGQQCSDGG
jgi:hypothetical protein